MKNTKKGFTLIELLVVIAIIGILAAIVLASLNTARNKGADAAIKADLANVRTQAALYYDTNSNFGVSFATTTGATCSGAVFNDTTIQAQLVAAQAQSGQNLFCGAQPSSGVVGTANASMWSVAIPLKAVAGQSWCVSDTGASKQIATPGSAGAFAGC